MNISSTSKNSKKVIREWIELSENRSNTYTLLSRIWGAEVDEILWKQLCAASFPDILANPILNAAYHRLEQALQNSSPDKLTDLRVDFARLCLGSDPREGADPYESVHRNKEGLMMQDEWEAVLRLYDELGLGRSESTHESEDYLAIELECVAQLCNRQELALRSGELPEASWWVEQQLKMLNEHLLRWVPSFVKRVQKLGQTEFYKAFATITEEYLKMDEEVLTSQ